ncbi:ankyrin repeat-containing domain protein [Xylaria acuta]|nr:ankyrin repeat-containing domain protein [Xylaria acuta]
MASAPGQIMVEAANLRTLPDQVYVQSHGLTDYADRFNTWAGSLGVFQKGESSLDARLSNHYVSHGVVGLLKQLGHFISDLRGIVNGSREQRVWTASSLRINADEFSDSDEFSSDSDEVEEALASTSGGGRVKDEAFYESKELHLSIVESTTSLLRLSVLISKSARRTKFAKSSTVENYSVEPDINHVQDSFPHASKNPSLKLSLDLSGPTEQRLLLRRPVDDGDSISLAMVSTDDHRRGFSASSLTETKATTFRSGIKSSVYSASKVPETSFGRSSMAAADEQHSMVPEPPHDLLLGQPYFCRYCCNMIEIQGKNAWQIAMVEHLKSVHHDQIPKGQEEIVTSRFGRPISHINAADCSLCDYPIFSVVFGRHLSRHLEQLALFVLPISDLVGRDETSDAEALKSTESDNDDGGSERGIEILSEPDLVQKLDDITSAQNGPPEALSKPPDLAMRWQPPQDFTPPLDDFYTNDVDLLPARQEPIFGGDLHTPGWARGFGSRKEGFCARCPVSHWVNISDGSYAFHLSYFHGVPASGVPLPRPSTIRPVAGKLDNWEGFCEACQEWKLLKKTKRGWNWYRHWLNDHTSFVKSRTDAVRSGSHAKTDQLSTLGNLPDIAAIITHGSKPTEAGSQISFERLERRIFSASYLFALTRNDKSEDIETYLLQFRRSHTPEELKDLLAWTDDVDQNLLMTAACQGLDPVVSLVLEMGGDPNVIDCEGQTALDLATDAGFFSTAQLLIKGGADASKSHIFKRILTNEREYAGEMTDATDIVGRSVDMHTASIGRLGQFTLNGDIASVRTLLGSDDGPSSCDIEEGAESGHSPFLLACSESHFVVMELLLSRGANINATSKEGWTPLMLASKRNDEISVSYLLSNGAGVNHLSPDRWTALTEATRNGSIKIIRRLLKAGADPEVKAQSDWTPLMHACFRGHIECVQLLLNAGASPEGVSARDETNMLLAAASGSPAVVKLLLDAGCAPDSVWSMAQRGNIGGPRSTDDTEAEVAIASTLPRTAEERIERAYRVGWTPLMVASQVGSLQIVAMLLDAGANPDSQSPMFKTAVEIARENGRMDVAEYITEWLHKSRSLK